VCDKNLARSNVVISGAAGNFLARVLGMSSNAFKTVIKIDLLGTFNVLRACYAYIRKPGASIISITAGQAVRPMMFQAHAGAAKAGINNLTQTLAMEWRPAGIRVNAIAPGPTGDTEGMARLAPSPESTAALKAKIPLRDYGSKQDIADMAVFLCSDNAKYITGAIFDCDGGSVLGDASADALTVPSRCRPGGGAGGLYLKESASAVLALRNHPRSAAASFAGRDRTS
jgi:NAD(P)-dependent dehydrogenase (short-subunit alcohol dehydrogenase family)